MAYTLEQLSADIRHALKADPGPAGKQAACALVSKVSLDKEFVAQHLTADQCQPRKVLSVLRVLREPLQKPLASDRDIIRGEMDWRA